MCYHSPPNQSCFAEKKAGAVICDLMRKYGSKERGVTLSGLRAIHNLAAGGCQENQQQLSEAGVCSLVRKEMSAFPVDRSIPIEVCRAITHLTTRNKANQDELRMQGLLLQVLRTLRNHLDEKHVVVHSCRALAAMAHENKDTQQLLGEIDAQSALLAALQRWYLEDGGADIVVEVLQAVIDIASKCPVGQNSFGGSNEWCVMLVSLANRLPPELSSKCQLLAWSTIASLFEGDGTNTTFDSSSIKIKLIAAGMMKAAAHILSSQGATGTTGSDTQLEIVRVVGLMIDDDISCRKEMASSGVLGAALDVVRGYMKDIPSPFDQPGGVIITKMLYHSKEEEEQQLVVDLGMLDLLHLILTRNSSDITPTLLLCEALVEVWQDGSRSMVLQEAVMDCGICEDLLALLEIHVKEEQLGSSVLRAISVMAAASSECQARLGDADAPAAVTTALQEHEQSLDVTISSFQAMAALAYCDADNQELFEKSGSCVVVCKVLDNYPLLREVQVFGLEAVAKLTYDCEGNATICCGAHIAGVIHRALSSYPQDDQVVSWAIESVINIMACQWAESEVEGMFTLNGASDLVIALLQKHQNDPLLLIVSLNSLINLCDRCSDCPKYLPNVHQLLTSILLQYRDNGSEVQQRALSAVAALVRCDIDYQEVFSGIGITTLVLSALQSHLPIETVIAALDAFICLVADSEDNHERLCEEGACRVLQDVLRGHGATLPLAWKAVAVMADGDPYFRQEWGATQPSDLLLSMLTSSHLTNEVVVWLLSASLALVADNSLAKGRLIENGVVGWVLSAAHNYAGDEEVQRRAMELVLELGLGGSSGVLLPTKQVVAIMQLLVNACKACPADVTVHLQVMKQMVSLPKRYPHLVCPVVCEFICETALRLAHEKRVTMACLQAIGSLAADSPENQEALGNSGACSLVVNALVEAEEGSSSSCRKERRICCQAAAYLALNHPANRERLRAAASSLLSIMNTWPTTPPTFRRTSTTTTTNQDDAPQEVIIMALKYLQPTPPATPC